MRYKNGDRVIVLGYSSGEVAGVIIGVYPTDIGTYYDIRLDTNGIVVYNRTKFDLKVEPETKV